MSAHPRPGLLRRPGFPHLCAATFTYFTAMGLGMAVLPTFMLGPVGGTKLELGLAIAAFSVMSLLLRPAVVPAARRVAPPVLMAAGAALVGGSQLLLVANLPAAAIVPLRGVAGAGESFFFVLASAAAYDLVPRDRQGEAMTYFSAALSAGLLVSPVGGLLLRRHAGYHSVWLVQGGLYLLTAALAASLTIPLLPAAKRRGPRLLHRAGIRPGLLLGANTWSSSAFTTFTALYVAHRGHGDATPEFAVFAVALIGIRLIAARALDRVDLRLLAAGSFALQALALVLFTVARTTPELLLCSGLIGAGAGVAYPSLMALAVRSAPPGDRTEVLATATAFFDAGYAVSALALALALQLAGYPAVYACAAAVLTTAALTLVPALSAAGIGASEHPSETRAARSDTTT